MLKPKIAITIGDPAGIGPEIVYRTVNSLKIQRVCSPVVLGDKQVINKYFDFKQKNVEFCYTSDYKKKFKLSQPSKISGLIACHAVKKAVELCINKYASAMVTAPVSKESFKLAGVKAAGHTELLASLTGSKKFCMMMVCDRINSVMVTRHLPVSKLSVNINKKDIIDTVQTSADFLEKISGKKIKIIVCSLNPHAGDNGILGFEEKKYIGPAVSGLLKKGYNIEGPVSSDAAWADTVNGKYDLIAGMYHDQIMIPLKVINGSRVVNVTAGLPFLRTSPGHGTAFDIAGKNTADITSMTEAVLYAVKNLK